jgi:hypothetical protein
MADPGTLSLAATGLSLGASVFGAVNGMKADEQAAQNAENQAAYGKLQATQTDTAMRRQMAATLSNISAVRATTETAPNSPTGMAVMNNYEGRADDVRQQKVANIMAQVGQDQQQADFYKQAGTTALFGSLMGGAGTAIGALTGGAKSGGGLNIPNPFNWSATP